VRACQRRSAEGGLVELLGSGLRGLNRALGWRWKAWRDRVFDDGEGVRKEASEVVRRVFVAPNEATSSQRTLAPWAAAGRIAAAKCQ
jgi:hypothetical protein